MHSQESPLSASVSRWFYSLNGQWETSCSTSETRSKILTGKQELRGNSGSALLDNGGPQDTLLKMRILDCMLREEEA